jgi:hypothetical protein
MTVFAVKALLQDSRNMFTYYFNYFYTLMEMSSLIRFFIIFDEGSIQLKGAEK